MAMNSDGITFRGVFVLMGRDCGEAANRGELDGIGEPRRLCQGT